jgi:hypothetical protein
VNFWVRWMAAQLVIAAVAYLVFRVLGLVK